MSAPRRVRQILDNEPAYREVETGIWSNGAHTIVVLADVLRATGRRDTQANREKVRRAIAELFQNRPLTVVEPGREREAAI